MGRAHRDPGREDLADRPVPVLAGGVGLASHPQPSARLTILFVAGRAARALAVLLGVVGLVFLLISAAPGDPAALAARAGSQRLAASPEALAAFREAYGLDRPAPERLLRWVSRAATLDFGRSFLDGRPVGERIAETLPTTLGLNLAALALAALVGVPAGIRAARRPGGPFDRISSLAFDTVFSLPSFTLGMLLLLLLAVRFPVFPLFSDPSLGVAGLVLPVVTLALPAMAALSRLVRALLVTELRSPATLAARARGESAAQVTRRGLRRGAGTLLAFLAVLVPAAASGSVLVERLFSVHGSAGLLAEAVFARDYPTVLGLTVVSGLIVVLSSLLAEVLAAALDRRRLEELA